MPHPTRYLVDYVAGELKPSRHRAVERHVAGCSRCRDAVAQEESILRRLRSASAPGPPADLCDRILRRSAAAGNMHGSEHTPGAPELTAGSASGSPRGTFAYRNRAALAVGGGLTVVAAATLTVAYALGSEVRPSEVTALAGSGSVTESFEAVAAGASSQLSAEEIDRLRSEGWFCPELQSLGFQLERAQAHQRNGRPTLQMDLSDGRHSLTIYEQRAAAADTPGSPPINAATGNTVTADGFEEIGGTEQAVWLHPGRAWQLVIDSGPATYTVVSTLPVADMPRAVSQLMLTERSQLVYSRPEAPDDPVSRIMRGLGKLAQPSQEHR